LIHQPSPLRTGGGILMDKPGARPQRMSATKLWRPPTEAALLFRVELSDLPVLLPKLNVVAID